MGQKRRKKACKTPPSTPKDPRETPKTTNHDGTVAPSGCPWPCAGGPQGRPEDTLRAPRGPPKQRQTKTQSPLTKNAEDKKRTTKNTPQIRSTFTRVLCSGPSEGLFWRRRGSKKTQKPSFYISLGSQGVQQRQKTLYLTTLGEHTPVATKAFGTDLRRDLRPGAPLGARPHPQNTT